MSTTTTDGNDVAEREWEALREKMRSGGAAAVIDHIGTFEPADRLKLYNFAQTAFSGRRAELGGAAGFDDYIAVVRAGIDQALEMAGLADDPDIAARRKDLANIFSFNLSADLAECWPEDTRPRERRHFEEGLRAAADCIGWREELGKDPSRKALAQWAKGMHLLSLGNFEEARATFATALRLSEEFAAASGNPTDATPEADFSILLGHGYLGIAESLAGGDEGSRRYDRAIETFTTQAERFPDRREDAEFGIAQLRCVHSKFLA